MTLTFKPLLQQLQISNLKITKDSAAYALHTAALEWDLQEPIVIEGEQDIKSRPSWRESLEPYHHQVRNLITFCRRLPVTLLADDVGLGKTISAGLVLSELISRERVNKVLVICPRLLMPQWKEELKTKFGIDSDFQSGKDVLRVLSGFANGRKGALITTYSSARLYFDHFEKAGFEMLILDEAHKLRNLYGTDKPPQVAKRIRKALADRTFKYVLMLTATPIQNRLWDLYSLVDLMTVAKGHKNPFGTEDNFARRFIADSAGDARHLRQDQKNEFRSIVYSYMSRVRRADAMLVFPERIVKLHRVSPTLEELKLIQIIANAIQNMNALAQVSILQALVSSPQALSAQLKNMAEKGTVPHSLSDAVSAISKNIRVTAKLQGLDSLIAQLRTERPNDWRLVIFTGRLETQKTIGDYLDRLGVSCGFISGESHRRNQETIQRFRKSPPEINVIVSTEAGSEGVNLQSANVLMNYDLPWNPMIVEQRIGRIQRLGSEHKNVIIFNSVLQNTFEEKIVSRLMEKLQLASQAIGDIESLLEQAGFDEEGENSKFEDMIRKLVLSSLAGKDVERDIELKIESISNAKVEIEREENNINSLLGTMDDPLRNGPRAPKLSKPQRSMDIRSFVLNVFSHKGSPLREEKPGVFVRDLGKTFERIVFDQETANQFEYASVLYGPGKPGFDRLVGQNLSDNECLIEGFDLEINRDVEKVVKQWVESFKGNFESCRIKETLNRFSGNVLLRIRIGVAHDSYEKLIEIPCESSAPKSNVPFESDLSLDPGLLGIDFDSLIGNIRDTDLMEFCRFYIDRLSQELKSAGDDERKRAKLVEDFTPRIYPSLVGLNGVIDRELQFEVLYKFQNSESYLSNLSINSKSSQINTSPSLETCELTGNIVPSDCLVQCVVTKKRCLRHTMVRSSISEKWALPEHIVTCGLTGKKVVSSETEVSFVTGKPIISSELKSSSISGKRAEPEHFGFCDFSGIEILKSELAISQISGKRYRNDQESKSVVTSKTGHQSEFIKSSISNLDLLEQEAIRSSSGHFCTPDEAKTCAWGGKKIHPEDMKICFLTGVEASTEFIGKDNCFQILTDLLNGSRRSDDLAQFWPQIAKSAEIVTNGKCKIDSAVLSPSKNILGVSVEVRNWMGLKVRNACFLYSLENQSILGRVAIGKRTLGKWVIEN